MRKENAHYPDGEHGLWCGSCNANRDRRDGRYVVRRTLSYARTFYGSTDDLAQAQTWAARQTSFGYPSEVIDQQHNDGT